MRPFFSSDDVIDTTLLEDLDGTVELTSSDVTLADISAASARAMRYYGGAFPTRIKNERICFLF